MSLLLLLKPSSGAIIARPPAVDRPAAVAAVARSTQIAAIARTAPPPAQPRPD